ncbi:MAG: response regulator [Thermoflexales bacterium]|nr:response regulator [Thermoflexales bacterium]
MNDFDVVLDYADDEQGQEPGASLSPPAELDVSEGSILIVDDTPANLRLLSIMLAKQGHKVRVANSGQRALESVQANPPDLILLDIMMPEMSGYEVCKRLKSDVQTSDIPVIFLSALDATESKVSAFRAGGVDYITKPFQLEEVIARVETHLVLYGLQKKLQEQNAQLEREVTERLQAEDTMRRFTERLQLLHEIDQAILGAQSPASIAMAILGRISHLVPCQRVSVVEFDALLGVQVLAVEAGRGFGTDITASLSLLRAAARKQKLIQGVADIAALPTRSPLQEQLLAEGVRSYLIVPLLAQDDVIGTLNLEADHPHVFAAEHIEAAAQVAGMLAVAIRQAQLRDSLSQRTAELEAQNAELDAFAHTVAHDLKNPLAVIAGNAELLARYGSTMKTEDLQRIARSASQGVHKTVSIVDNLLLLASAHKQTVEPRVLDMGGIVSEVRDRLSIVIQESQPEIIVPETWPHVLGYAPWIEEVWANYLSNALKYGGRPPRVELGYSESQIANRKSQIKFWVRDNGRGLTPEEQSHLFTPFERLSQARIEGHGLGLSIVQRIVHKLGGQVGVESTADQGSVFYFTLPAASETGGSPPTAHTRELQPAAAGAETEASRPQRVLLVEDSQLAREMGLRLLGQLGYQVDVAGNGLEALEALRQRSYDLILMDVHMPDMDGLEATRTIRRQWPPEQQPPIFAMTADAAPEDWQACLEAGMDGYVGKPMQIAELQAALKHWGKRPA